MKSKTILKRILGIIVAVFTMPVIFGTIFSLDSDTFSFMEGFYAGLAVDVFVLFGIFVGKVIVWAFDL